jgi:hypothetical protein
MCIFISYYNKTNCISYTIYYINPYIYQIMNDANNMHDYSQITASLNDINKK